VALVFIVAGLAGLLNDLWPLLTSGAADQMAKLRADGLADLVPAWTTRVMAIVGGIGVLRGRNWGRWVLAAWMVLHIGLSFLHSLTEVLLHTAIFTPLAYFLFSRSADPFFRVEPVSTL
jgi:hypothetical protein